MKIMLCGLLSVLLLFTLPVSAINLNFMKDSPVRYYNDKDWSLFEAAEINALDNHKDGSKVSWSNPANDHNGIFIPSHTTKKNGVLCRQMKIVSNANHRYGVASFKFCKIDNDWKVVS